MDACVLTPDSYNIICTKPQIDSNAVFNSHRVIMSHISLRSILAICLSLSIMIWLLALLYKLFRTTRRHGTPFVRSSPEAVAACMTHMTLQTWDIFLDLGCGDWYVMHAVGQAFPWVIVRWYELLSTLPEKESSQTFASQKKTPVPSSIQNHIIHQDFFAANFSGATVIYCYSLPRLLPSIWSKIQRECTSGTLFYSNVFSLPYTTPTDTIAVTQHNGKKTHIFVYTVT